MPAEQENGGWLVVEESLEVDSAEIQEAPPTGEQGTGAADGHQGRHGAADLGF
jgi:hypothetical protein